MRNKKTLLYLVVLTLGFILSGCSATKPMTKGEAYPKMYEEQPRSLLILPPMNESTDAEAKDYYMTTTEMPFALMGYYTFPSEMVSDIMKQEGIYDTELLYGLPMNKFYEYFGADAVLMTKIRKWDVAYAVVASTLTVVIEAKIVSTKTSEVLWAYVGAIKVNLGGDGNTNGGLAGLLVQAVITAVATASADYVTYAHKANAQIIHSLPAGPYSEQYMLDESQVLLPYGQEP